jgi:hypothetical protein
MLQIFKKYQTSSFRGQLHDPGRATVFMHIPKACGTAVRLGLLEALAPRRELLVHDRVMFGSFNGFESFEAETRRSICLNPASLDQNADFVTGHISFSTLAARYPDAQFLTVLREPISRIISHWLFWQNFSGERLNAYGEYASRLLQSRAPLGDFLSSRDVASQTDNVHLRMLLWPHRLIPEGNFIDPRFDNQLLQEARVRLQKFAFIDVVENPRFSAGLEQWLGRPFNYRWTNETPPSPSTDKSHKSPFNILLNSELFDLLETRCRLDLKLWLLTARKTVNGIDPTTLRARTLMLNVARHARWVATDGEKTPEKYEATIKQLQSEFSEQVENSIQLRRQIDSIHQSVCWRLTAPLRWLHRIVSLALGKEKPSEFGKGN